MAVTNALLKVYILNPKHFQFLFHLVGEEKLFLQDKCWKFEVCLGYFELTIFHSFCVSLFADVKGPPTHRLSCGQSPYAETAWDQKYCMLTDSQMILLNREEEVMIINPELPINKMKSSLCIVHEMGAFMQ